LTYARLFLTVGYGLMHLGNQSFADLERAAVRHAPCADEK
jgi:hypothetical protein